MKGSDRNKPCPCGSGVKAKKCPNHERKSIYERLNVRAVPAGIDTSSEKPVAEVYGSSRGRVRSALAIAAIAAALDVPRRR